MKFKVIHGQENSLILENKKKAKNVSVVELCHFINHRVQSLAPTDHEKKSRYESMASSDYIIKLFTYTFYHFSFFLFLSFFFLLSCY